MGILRVRCPGRLRPANQLLFIGYYCLQEPIIILHNSISLNTIYEYWTILLAYEGMLDDIDTRTGKVPTKNEM